MNKESESNMEKEIDPTQEAEINTEETQEEVNELSHEEELEIQIKESKDKYLRLYSEFDNFRRRTAKEKLDLISTAGANVLTSILPILDDFERAFLNEDVKNDEEVMKGGFGLIHKKLLSILDQKGLKVQEVNIGDPFDAEVHSAIAQVPAPKKKMRGKIMDVVEKGYLLNDKMLRHAKVVVGS